MKAFRNDWTVEEVLAVARTQVYYDAPDLMNALELMFL